ncbi:protein Hsh49p [[Candida] anglica]
MNSVFRKPADSDRNVQATVYIGNLDPQVTEPLLYELLVQFAPVRTLNFPKDRILKTHQGYGFAEFRTAEDAEYVLEVTRGVRLFGKSLKFKKTESGGSKTSQQDQHRYQQQAALNTSNAIDVGAKLFINNLNPLIDEQFLQDTFSKFGTLIRPPIIIRDESGVSKGYGFLTFADFSISDAVIAKMAGGMLMNMKVDINYAYKEDASGKRVRHGDRAERLLAESAKTNNLLKNEIKVEGKKGGRRK